MNQNCRTIFRIVLWAALTVSVCPGWAAEPVNVPSVGVEKMLYDPTEKSEMDLLASAEDQAAFVGEAKTDGVLFTEDRRHSIRWNKALPKRWLTDRAAHTGSFRGKAQPGEFYVFQVGVFAAKRDLKNLSVEFGDLEGNPGKIEPARLRCITLGGSDFLGRPLKKEVSVAQGQVQALWIGVEVPEKASGAYRGKLTVKDAAGFAQTLDVALEIGGEVLTDHGDHDSWRLSRLRWLDSKIGLDDDVVTQPYQPIARQDTRLNFLGHGVELDPVSGLPAQVMSHYSPSNTAITDTAVRLFSQPLRFVIETETGPIALPPATVKFLREQKGAVVWQAVSKTDALSLTVDGLLEFDGFLRYGCSVSSARDLKIQDIRLETEFAQESSPYFMGLGQPSGKCPDRVDWKWNPKFNQDGVWIGAVNSGAKIQFFGGNWRTPLINCYYHFRPLLIPDSWGGADGQSGGIRLDRNPEGNVRVVAYSGARTMKAGESLLFGFNLYLTPFHPINTEEQWALRYLHPNQGVEDPALRDLASVKKMGANVVNIHHNKEQNPTINYPYFDLSMPLLKECVAKAHENGIKLKIYYTTREITNNLPELFAFWSLNGEIICPGPGKEARPLTNGNGPHPWLVEHLGETGFIPAWREVIQGRYKGLLDLAVITTPDSRLNNFYLEGLAFTLCGTDFDGLYIDDTALDRKSFQRAHRIFEAQGKHLLVDMHSWSHLDPTAGSTPSAYCFMQNFPYYHRIWFGEGHNYNANPDHWLVELSGIPFGLMSEMLEGGGNKWRGMLYGMTQRLGWSGDPRPQWKFWDEFGMTGTKMIGYWDPACPVRTNRSDVLATVYLKKDQALICLASWAPEPVRVKLDLDWKALGLDPATAQLTAPPVEDFQEAHTWVPTDEIEVQPGRGWMVVLKNK
ncbi:MAG TPA: DUF6067 family protein [Candidatus Sumerlaeota bacterium]|nr:DUF6067 family protein [Candidatus Sumerlaeota bacterium]